VYDRWGGVVYESRSPTPAWDGSGASAGVYTYKILVENTLTGEHIERFGDVVLVR
ncbi:MAG: hypothetical protein D6714_04680, partial [Bacteroidetes bacterium]